MSAIILKLPSLSPTMEVGTIAEWKVKEGDFIKSGQVIASIATDKSTVDYESLDEGYLRKITMPQGSESAVGKVIAILTEKADEKFEEELNAALAKEISKAAALTETTAKVEGNSGEDEKSSKKVATPTGSGIAVAPYVPVSPAPKSVAQPIGFIQQNKNFVASPAAKKLAQQNKINLAAVKPKTTGHRIVLEDLVDLPFGFGMSEAEKGSGLIGYVNRSTESGSDIKLSQMRQAITARMVQASAGVPVFYLTIAVEMDRLMDIRAQLNSMENVKVSINDFVVKACALSLRAFPAVNAAYQGGHIHKFNDVDISVAVSIPDGLITPIVRSADTKGLVAISQEVKSLVAKAKTGSLKLEEYQGGSFSISNLGMFGAVEQFTAILNPPQAAILAIAGTNKELRKVNGEIKEISVCKMTLTADHRVIDGALAAEFMNALKGYLETPVKLIV